MRAARRVCRTVVLRLRFDDFSRATRSRTLSDPTAQTRAILAAARALLTTAAPVIESRGLTLVGVALTNLEDDAVTQLAFPFDRQRTLDATLDDLCDRYGAAAITRAVLLGRDEGLSVPLLPD
jgi:DNA polymerase IV